MKLIKVIDTNKTYKNKKGKEVPNSYFAIKYDNGKMTVIKPVYNDGYKALDFVAEVVFTEKKDK